MCSKQGGLKDFCVRNFRTAIGGGLDKVLSKYISRSKAGPAYRATFRLIEFSHSVTSGGAANAGGPSAKVAMRWQFELLGADGAPVVQLAETTDGPQQFNNVDAADQVIDALLNAVMERIAASMKSSTWPSQGAVTGPAAFNGSADAVSRVD